MWKRRIAIALGAILVGPLAALAVGGVNLGADWRTADRSSVGIAPDPATTPEALVQVYAARAFNWRGIFGVHTWIATKERDAGHYVVHQVLGWRAWRGQRVVMSHRDLPDRSWYGQPPRVVAELRGEAAEAAIPKVLAAVATYPFPSEYELWPGPNSNTFTAYVTRQVPELRADLPPTAIGKDYLGNGSILDSSPSGSGFQLSIAGLAGVLVGVEEGVEVNVLGLAFGVDPLGPALRLPGIGRLGFELRGPKPASPSPG